MVPKGSTGKVLHALLRLLQENRLIAEGDSTEADHPLELVLGSYFESRLERIETLLTYLIERQQGRRCPLANFDDGTIARLMTGMGSVARSAALNHLGECMAGARQITICDPYFLKSAKTMCANDYVSEIDNVLPPSLATLEIFVGKAKRDKQVAQPLNDLFKRKKVMVTCIKTDHVHDRVWIKDYKTAYAIGTSFNGLGNKCAFILALPDSDLREFVSEIGRLRCELPYSRSL
jgi:hypothetical protein